MEQEALVVLILFIEVLLILATLVAKEWEAM